MISSQSVSGIDRLIMDTVLGKFSLRKLDRRQNGEFNEDLTRSPAYVAKFCPIRGICSLVAVGYENGRVVLEDSLATDPSNAQFESIRASERMAVFDLDWSTKRSVLVTASSDKTCRLVHVRQNGLSIGSHYSKHTKSVKCVKWMRDSDDVFASGGRDSTVYVWDRRIKSETAAVIRFQTTTDSCAFSNRKSPAVARARKRRRNGKEVDQDCSVQGIEFRDNVHMITVSDRDRHVKVWDLRRAYPESWSCPSTALHVIPYAGPHSGGHSFVSCVLDPHLSTLYVNSTDNSIYVYDAINFSAKPLRRLVGHRSQYMFPMDVSCDGSYLVTATPEMTCVVWDLGSKCDEPAVILGLDDEPLTGVSCHAFDPGVLSVCGDMSVSFWRVRSKREEVAPGEDDVLETAKVLSSVVRKSRDRSGWCDVMFYNQYGMRGRFRRYRYGQAVGSFASRHSDVFFPRVSKSEICHRVADEDKENLPLNFS